MRGAVRTGGEDLTLAVADGRGQQPFEGRAVASGKVGDVAAVYPEEHLGGGMPQLPGDPFGCFAAGQPQGGGRVPTLIGATVRESEMAQQRFPDAIGHVLVVEGLAFAIAEDELRQGAGALFLFLEGVVEELAHLDVALAAVGLGVFLFSRHDGFPDENQTAFEVDVLPLQSVDLAGAQSGEEAHGEVGAKIGSDRGEQALDVVQRKGIDVGALDLELFDIGIQHARIKQLVTSLRICRSGFSILLIRAAVSGVFLLFAVTLASLARKASTSALEIWPTSRSPKAGIRLRSSSRRMSVLCDRQHRRLNTKGKGEIYMTTLAFVMLVITIFVSLMGMESSKAEGNNQLSRATGLWTWLTTGNWSAKLGAGLIILGVGALLRYLLINVELPDLLKLGSGIVLSLLLTVAALALRAQRQRRGLRLALAGAAGGVAYLTAYSAYALFHYVTLPSTAFALLLLVAVMVGVIAVHERAQSMAVLAMLGGFIAPYFALEKASPLELNGYYLLLSLLVLVMVMLRGWRSLIHLSFLFTLAATLFFGWCNNYYEPQYFRVMLPMLLALTAVHLLMPLLEGSHAVRRVTWLQRTDEGYAWALPLTALVLAFQLAPAGDLTALTLALLAGLWLAGAVVAHLKQRPSARYLWWAGAMLLAAAVEYLHDLSLPWALLGVLIAAVLYVSAPRLGLQSAHCDWLAMAILMLAALHIAETAFGIIQQRAPWAYVQHFILAGVLLETAWVGHRRGNGFVAVMGWAGGLWGALALVSLLIELKLTHWSSILFVVGLIASGTLYALRHHTPFLLAPAALAVWLTVSGQAAATEAPWPWTLLSILCLLFAMGLLALTTLRDADEDQSNAVASAVLLLLPLALWPWMYAEGHHWGWGGSSFNLSILMIGVLICSVIARYRLPNNSNWHNYLAPVVFYAVTALLTLRLVSWIEREAWDIIFEVLALVYLALRIRWTSQESPDDALTRRYQLVGVLLAALFLQALALRLWGPAGDVLNLMDLRRMSAPVLLSLLWAVLGALLAIAGHRIKERSMWSTGAGLLVLAAGKIVLLDTGSLGSLQNILAVISAGGLFLAVSWWAPFPPARPKLAPKPRTDKHATDQTHATMPITKPTQANRSRTVAKDGWHDTIPMDHHESSSQPHLSSVNQKQLPPTRSTLAPPADNMWAWVAGAGLILMMAAGYQSLQKFEHQRSSKRAEHHGKTVVPPRGNSVPPAVEIAAHTSRAVTPPTKSTTTVSDVTPPLAPAPKTPSCTFEGVKFPTDMVVYAAGGYSGRELNFQIDRSGHQATQFDVAVNSPKQPVALMLGAYEPTIWTVSWTEGTDIVAVLVSGYHKQVITGLKRDTPILNSSYDNRGACGYFYVNREQNIQLNPMARRLFDRPVNLVFPGNKFGSIVVGEPIKTGFVPLISEAISPLSFRDMSTPLAGQDGLDDAIAKGSIRPATDADKDAWTRAVSAGSPPIAGQNSTSLPRASRRPIFRSYVVLKEFTYPTGLYGADSVVYFIAKGVPRPKGNPGHSRIYDFNTLQCHIGNSQPNSIDCNTP